MEAKDEIREQAEAIAFWLADENKEARKELEQRQPELGQWLDMVEKRVAEKLKEVEAQEATMRE